MIPVAPAVQDPAGERHRVIGHADDAVQAGCLGRPDQLRDLRKIHGAVLGVDPHVVVTGVPDGLDDLRVGNWIIDP
jgi:hypothetical protein